MDENEFWSLIDRSREGGGDDQEERLEELLTRGVGRGRPHSLYPRLTARFGG